jgi:hypothetical protein
MGTRAAACEYTPEISLDFSARVAIAKSLTCKGMTVFLRKNGLLENYNETFFNRILKYFFSNIFSK